MRRTPEAMRRPPRPPRRLSPSAIQNVGTRWILRRYISFTRADGVAPVLDLLLDVVPLPVLVPAVAVAKVVLPAQFIGNVRCRRREIAETPDDLGPAARVVRNGEIGRASCRERV